MAQKTPLVCEINAFSAHLISRDLPDPIVVDSPEWFAWLEQESSTLFAFQAASGSYTARKENSGSKRGSSYWKAYRKFEGKLYRAYLGKSADLSLLHLTEVCQSLSSRIQDLPAAKVPQAKPLRNFPTQREPLLETKLQPPRLPPNFVARPRLLALLNNVQWQKLTLIQAPAGFGKTTLTTQWLRHQQNLTPDLLVAWISLDNADNDPIRFWATLIAACRIQQPNLGATALAQLSQTARFPFTLASLEIGLTFLLNELGRLSLPLVFVLEDYHLIEQPQIHQSLTFFIEHLPASVHLIILSRSEPPLPLARWRAKGDLTELSSHQMRFTPEETSLFITQLLPQAVSRPTLPPFHNYIDYIEGWAAGLRLLALSVQGSGQLTDAARLPELTAGWPTMPTPRVIEEFFLTEILGNQSEALQLFLLQTSLFNRLTGSLCQAVTGQPDSPEWLEFVCRAGFFLEALDNAGRWYRYHPLFAETLRREAARRLGEQAVRQLFRQASSWYTEQAMFAEAIETALTAQEFEQAAALICNLNLEVDVAEHHTIRRWLAQIPAPQLNTSPLLCFRYAQAQLFAENSSGDPLKVAAVEDWLQSAEAGWRKQGNLPEIGMLFAFRASMVLLEGSTRLAANYARQAFQFFSPESGQLPFEWVDWFSGSHCALGLEAIYDGRMEMARQHLLQAHALSLTNPDRVFTRIVRRMLADVFLELGELQQAASSYQQILADNLESAEQGTDIIEANSLAGQARLFYERNELIKAEELANQVSAYNYHGHFLNWEEEARLRGELLKLAVWQTQGKINEVQQQLNALLVHLQASPTTLHLIPDLLARQARWQLENGTLAAAERTLNDFANYLPRLFPLQQAAYSLLLARLSMAQNEPEKALDLLEQLLIEAQQSCHTSRLLEIRLVSALAYSKLGQKSAANQQLLQVLSQAQPAGFLRLFLDEGAVLADLLRDLLPSLTDKILRRYVQNILAAFSETTPTSSPAITKDQLALLSAQEKRIFYLLSVGHTNLEIAEKLVVSVNTIKGYVKNIYRKLDINNRVQASALARQVPQHAEIPDL